MSNLFSQLGNLDTYINFSGTLSFMDSYLTAVVYQFWYDSTKAPVYWVYAGIIYMIIAAFISAAIVTVSAVDTFYPELNVLASDGSYSLFGYYFTYAGGSIAGNRLGYIQAAVLLLYEAWALTLVIAAIYAGMNVWDMVDARLAEAAASSIGVETPLTMDKAIKAFTLLLTAGLTSIISGYALAMTGRYNLFYQWWYSIRTKTEGCQKDDGGDCDIDGTAFENDQLYQIIITAYSFIAMSAIVDGGYYFAYQFIGLDDGFACDLQENVVSAATYAGITPILAAATDRASCKKTIQQVFDIEDLDKDGKISRCEDATLQRAFGATKEYAFKFSSPFTRASFEKICDENFTS